MKPEMESKFLEVDEKFTSMLEELTASEKSVDSQDLRRVMADYSEDHEAYSLAECLRWMAENKKRPYVGKEAHCWFNQGKITEGLGDTESDVETSLFDLIEVGQNGSKQVANHKVFSTIKECEVALYKAWIKRGSRGKA